MKLKYLLGIMLLVIFCIITLPACNTPSEKSNSIIDDDQSEVSQTRIIKDLSGNDIAVPYAKDIEKVIIVAPPYLSFFLSVVQQPEMVVGAHPGAFNMANPELLKIMMPNQGSVNTQFLDGFKSNTEEVLLMDPDIIFIYGEFQREGLEKVDIPIVNLQESTGANVESSSLGIVNLMRDIFEIKGDNLFQKEWEQSNKLAKEVFEKNKKNEQQRGLVVFSNTSGTITVRGVGSFGDDWLKTSGLINVVEMQGDNLEVSMEDIYNWDPDIIYTMGPVGAETMIANQAEGQDWSYVNAFKSERIYDIPESLTKWHAGSPDAPLTLLWMLSKNFPDDFSEEEYNEKMKQYYKNNYSIELTDSLLESILYPIRN